jgi:tetratricopeptide (TPR) repeat protein
VTRALKGAALREFAISILMLGSAVAQGERIRPGAALEYPGFAQFYNCEYDQALAVFRAKARAEPSADAFNHIAQTLIFRAMFRANALDTEMVANTQSFLHMPKVSVDAADETEFQDAIRQAMSLAQTRLDNQPNDTGALYSLGVSHGLMANYRLVVQKRYRDSLREATAARKLHNRATEIDPDFVDARLTQGLNDYIVGSLPLAWRMLGFLGGFHGDRQRGIQTLELVAEHGAWNQIDAKMMLAAIYRREKMPEKSVAVLNELIPRLPRNYALRLELAEMYIDLGEPSHAREIVAEVERMKAERAPGFESVPEDKIRKVRAKIAPQEHADARR